MDTCRLCDARRDPGTADALAWTHEPPAAWLCPTCTRTHTRDVESRLPDEWWN